MPSSRTRLHWMLLIALVAPSPWAMAAKPGKEEKRAAKREAAMANTDGEAKAKTPADAGETKGKSNADTAQARVMDRLRTKLEIKDDEEWAVISARIARVEELQRSAWSGGVNNRGVISLGEKNKGAGASANADREALRAAVTDKLPDAEIKSRLSRAHEMRQQSEAALAQAQQDLRSVVSVRQEAVLVVAGLLPP